MQPTPEDMAVDLAALLDSINEHERTWMIALAWEGRTKYAFPEYSRFQNHLPLIARAAARRALTAESRVRELEDELQREKYTSLQTIRELRGLSESLDAENTRLEMALRQLLAAIDGPEGSRSWDARNNAVEKAYKVLAE